MLTNKMASMGLQSRTEGTSNNMRMKKTAFILLGAILLLASLGACQAGGSGTLSTTSSLTSSTASPGTPSGTTKPTSSLIDATGPSITRPDQFLVQITLSTFDMPNPGGPNIEITLRNIVQKPIVSVTAVLKLERSHEYTFAVSSSSPLLPGQSISSHNILIGEGFDSGVNYPVTIRITFQDGSQSMYTQQAQIGSLQLQTTTPVRTTTTTSTPPRPTPPAVNILSIDYTTIKYDVAGNQTWAVSYNGAGEYDNNAHAVAVDAAGNVYVTGDSSGTAQDYATIKYDNSGKQLWVARYNGPADGYDTATAPSNMTGKGTMSGWLGSGGAATANLTVWRSMAKATSTSRGPSTTARPS